MLICAVYVVSKVSEKKKVSKSSWLNMTNNEVMVAQKHVVVKVALWRLWLVSQALQLGQEK